MQIGDGSGIGNPFLILAIDIMVEVMCAGCRRCSSAPCAHRLGGADGARIGSACASAPHTHRLGSARVCLRIDLVCSSAPRARRLRTWARCADRMLKTSGDYAVYDNIYLGHFSTVIHIFVSMMQCMCTYTCLQHFLLLAHGCGWLAMTGTDIEFYLHADSMILKFMRSLYL